jgi:hypothetical protein
MNTRINQHAVVVIKNVGCNLWLGMVALRKSWNAQAVVDGSVTFRLRSEKEQPEPGKRLRLFALRRSE